MLTFNTLLRGAGLDPARTQLVRHQDTRVTERSPYTLWRDDPDGFGFYQRLQSLEKFDSDVMLASFVVPPNGETLFAGMYRVTGLRRNTETVFCPLWRKSFEPGSMNLYDITPMEALSRYAGLLTIEWGGGKRSWVQRAEGRDRKEKPILELRLRREEPLFPKIADFQKRSDEIPFLPATWAEVLRRMRGVYLLVDGNGAQYVGSATGDEGFLSRWLAYARDGHGGNGLLRARGKPPYAIAILEVAGSEATRNEIIAAEQRWKLRLGSRAHGLNDN